MQEFLSYHFPNESTCSFVGYWKQLIDGSVPNGFVISDAHASEILVFETNMEAPISELNFQDLDNINSAVKKEEYMLSCSALIAEMRQNNVDKVVFSRQKITTWNPTFFVLLLEQLIETYPKNLNYALYSKRFGFWMGSTPEILIQSNEQGFESMALAGTLSADSVGQFWTDKERDEQQYVSDYLQQIIEENGRLIHKTDSYEHIVGPVKHLRTDFVFDLPSDKTWSFVKELHPTPAVCGVPKQEARMLYEKHEAHARTLYTGIIGRFDQDGQRLFVNLRCMQVFQNQACLFVGGGITQESFPENEWEETERKSEALGRFLI